MNRLSTRLVLAIFVLTLVPLWPVSAAEPVDLNAINTIRDEGLHHSKVMDHAWYLTERIGARLTGSPSHKEAAQWARETLESWGLDARLEAEDFGHGWSYDRCEVRAIQPFDKPLEAVPKAWTPGTDGPVRGRAVRATIKSEEDLEALRGTLEGAVLLLDEAREPEGIQKDEVFRRWDADGLAEQTQLELEEGHGEHWREEAMKAFALWPKVAEFLAAEGVVATVEVSSRDNALVRVTGGGTWGQDDIPEGVPAVVMATEPYNRLVRLVEHDEDVELELNISARYYRDDPKEYNVIAELPGTDLADQVVMAGAHLDSWHAGTGATDNGGNCAVVMEAIRLLHATGLKPRRTLRVALWFGEEQGFKGSRAYIARHIATRPEPTDPEQLALPSMLRRPTWPITPLPAHARLSAYFNLDYGSGRVRGIYTEENAAVRPIFEAWIAPLADLGVTTVSPRKAGGTDHVPFDRVGIPAFQFIQDPMDYMTRTHHSNVDTFDHLDRDDMVQSSVVLATFLWDAASRDERLPRKPMPRQPEPSAPARIGPGASSH